LLLIVFFTPCFSIFAGSGIVAKHQFKSTGSEVVLEPERVSTQVLLHLLIKDLKQYDHIIVERSPESANNFSGCKYISGSDAQATDDYLLAIDKYPYSSTKVVYYRIKTFGADGSVRTFPAIALDRLN
jgi:hypothetical protein